MRLCIFCLRHEGDAVPWVNDNPGQGCTYGFAHEYPEAAKPVKQEKKPDKNRCVKCNLHPKNPASATNECAHEYLEATP